MCKTCIIGILDEMDRLAEVAKGLVEERTKVQNELTDCENRIRDLHDLLNRHEDFESRKARLMSKGV
jgi:hypothetical protein